MDARMFWLAGACAFAATLVLGQAAALAGPCSDDIAALGKALSQSPQMGPATTGALAGSGPDAQLKPATGQTPATPPLQGTTAQGKLGGEGGTKEMNAVSGQVATSAQDVRRQQSGLPTMATDPNAKLSDSDQRMSQAKMALEQARSLDQKNDASCKDSVGEAQKLMQHG